MSTRKRRILEFTVHHTGSTKNIQDLRNFAHFAHETPSEKHKKEPLSYENGSFSKSAPNRNRTIKLIDLTSLPIVSSNVLRAITRTSQIRRSQNEKTNQKICCKETT